MSFLQKTLNLFLPPLCLACDIQVGESAALCPECWKKVQFISEPFCACCGAPFDVPVGEGSLCGACIADQPDFAKARAAMVYDDASKRIILGFKHADRTHATKPLANWMARAGADIIAHCDTLIPVPLHRWRLFKRRYNQSALLAKEIADISGKTFLPNTLRRIRDTETQGQKKRKGRQENVRGAFAVHPSLRKNIEGKKAVLIDDVMTTGATVNECAKSLLKAGATEVSVLTLSRVKGFI